MKYKLLTILALLILTMSFKSEHEVKKCKATFYNTEGHKKVHREYPTAAYYDRKYKNMKMVITNIKNNVTDTVIITDKHAMGKNHVDLSHMAFDRLTKLDTISDLRKRSRKRKIIGVIIVHTHIIK